MNSIYERERPYIDTHPREYGTGWLSYHMLLDRRMPKNPYSLQIAGLEPIFENTQGSAVSDLLNIYLNSSWKIVLQTRDSMKSSLTVLFENEIGSNSDNFRIVARNMDLAVLSAHMAGFGFAALFNHDKPRHAGYAIVAFEIADLLERPIFQQTLEIEIAQIGRDACDSSLNAISKIIALRAKLNRETGKLIGLFNRLQKYSGVVIT